MSSSTTPKQPTAHLYLVICNISKKANVKALLSTACAFGCKAILVVGQRSFDFDPQGQDVPKALAPFLQQSPIQRFEKWNECVEYLRSRRIRLVGVEIHKDAKPIEAFLDGHDTAFLMGNEGQGIQEKQMKDCDAFVRIPQYGAGTASLNVYVAASIILQRFHEWQRHCTNGTICE